MRVTVVGGTANVGSRTISPPLSAQRSVLKRRERTRHDNPALDTSKDNKQLLNDEKLQLIVFGNNLMCWTIKAGEITTRLRFVTV